MNTERTHFFPNAKWLPAGAFMLLAVILYIYSYLIAQRSLLFSKADGSFSLFNIGFLVPTTAYTALIIINLKRNPQLGILTAALSGMTLTIQSATLITLPLINDLCSNSLDSTIDQMDSCTQLNLTFIICAFASFLIIRLLVIGYELSPKWLMIFLMTASIIAAITLLLAMSNPNDKKAKTTTLFGVQIGLPLVFLMIVYLSIWFKREERYSDKFKDKILYALELTPLLFMVIAYAVRSEFGAIIYLASAVLIFLTMIRNKASFRIKLGFALIFLLMIIAVIIFYLAFCQGIKPEEGGIKGKIARIFVESKQSEKAIQLLKSTNSFGLLRYPNVPEAMSDYFTAAAAYCLGSFWFVLLILCFAATAISGSICFSSDEENNTARLSFSLIIVMTLLNIAGNLGMTGIVGINIYAGGKGIMHAILCGILFGSIVCENNTERTSAACQMLRDKAASIKLKRAKLHFEEGGKT